MAKNIQLTPDIMVSVTKIIDGETVFSAWQRLDHPISEHRASTICSHEGEWYGRIGSDPDKALFDHLPAWTRERSEAAKGAYQARFDLAYKLILEAYPAEANQVLAYRTDGMIYVDGPWSASLAKG